jgi:[ribosomal protein S5]-alanine N-acetyltransferase
LFRLRGDPPNLGAAVVPGGAGGLRKGMSESTSSIYLRPPISTDQAAFLSSVARSKQLHFPWVSPPASPKQFATFVGRMVPPFNYRFLVCTRTRDQPAGVINITNVVLGPFRSGYLEYYVFAGFERQGIMRDGLIAVVRHAFRKLKLHRLEANIQPANLASIALVRSCGFLREGYSPQYLKIRGRWRDHERWALVASQMPSR